MTDVANSGIPLGTDSGKAGILQPKMTWKFRVLFDRLKTDGIVLTEQVISITRPSINFEVILETNAYRVGSFNWDALTLVIRDDIIHNASRLIQAQIDAQKIDPTITFDMTIQTLKDFDTVIERWECQDCVIQRLDNSKFNYADSSNLTMTLTIKSRDIVHYYE